MFSFFETIWAKIIGAAVVLAGLLWAWHAFTGYVSAERVQEALVKERAVTTPKIDKLTTDLATANAAIAAKDAAATAELAKQTAEATQKQKLYDNLVKQNANLSAKLKSSFIATDTLAGQLRDITARSGAACAGQSDYPRRLGDALAQCETDLNRQLRATEEAGAIAADALAAARALRLSSP